MENLIFNRKEVSLNEYIKNKNLNLKKVEELIDTRYVKTDIEDIDYSLASITNKIKGLSKDSKLVCVNIVKRRCNYHSNNDICSLIEELKKFKVSILVVRDDVKIPEERADMIIDLSTRSEEHTSELQSPS